ncbi:MAG: hypothetical protein U1E65_15885 [Myxococcota bacterium]
MKHRIQLLALCITTACGPLDQASEVEQTAEAAVSEPNGTCIHPVTTTGMKLTTTCSQCAGNVCGHDSFCCNNTWDSYCVSEVSLYCGGNTCTPATCAQLGATCGTVSNGCGGTLSCGSCASGTSCSANQCVPTTAPVVTLIDNGGFELGLTGWTLGGNTMDIKDKYGVYYPVAAHSGSGYIQLALPIVSPPSLVTPPTLSRTVTLPANAKAIQVWHRETATAYGVTSPAYLKITGSYTQQCASNYSLSAWSVLSCPVTAFAGQTVTITLTRDFSNTVVVNFDDVALVQ